MTDIERKILERLGWKREILPELSDLATLDRIRCEWAMERSIQWVDYGGIRDPSGFLTVLMVSTIPRSRVAGSPTRVEAIQKAFLAALEAEAHSTEEKS